ncbi:MAG: MmgE/PrpD family protein, partial [Myxococcales bacterium]|nr:MmgE/PrpD family protein [Myxococcales bacterium]
MGGQPIARSASQVTTLAEWAAALRWEDLPPDVIEEAKSQIFSVLGALYAGIEDPAASKVGRAVVKRGEPGRATIFPGAVATSATAAVYAHAARTMALDFDDYLFCGHTGHSAVLVPMAIAEAEGRDGRAWILAQILANEIEGRLGAAALVGPL